MFEPLTQHNALLDAYSLGELSLAGMRVTRRGIGEKFLRRVSQRGSWQATPPRWQRYRRAHIYNGITVLDTKELDGGGWVHGQDYVRALASMGVSKVDRLCEFCAGPGYIGFSLLANGFCDQLCLVDVNPEATELMRETVRLNGLEDRVTVVQSDGLDNVPRGERWAGDGGTPGGRRRQL